MSLASAALAAHAAPRAAAAPAERYSRAGWASIGGLNPEVFDMALGAASCAERSGDVSNPRTLTVIDYSKPSTARRMFVYDLDRKTVLFEELVAHGSGSGGNQATAFSNLEDSHQSSLGLFITGQSYTGQNGYSLRLDGLDAGFNDRARDRAIVIHGAPYVSEAVASAQGRLGRSWGCPAVRAGIARELIDTVRGGGLLFAYYPDPNWLAASRYLRCDSPRR
jgi:L,D-transpeptidase-like protein